MSDKDEAITVLAGLLDFHSDRATAHASFIVASIFGLYAILFSFNTYFANDNVGIAVFVITYIFLALFSFYSFLNFSRYASIANAIQQIMEREYCLKDNVIREKLASIEKIKKETSFFVKKRTKLLLNFQQWKGKIPTLIVAWIITVFLPFFWILIKYVLMS